VYNKIKPGGYIVMLEKHYSEINDNEIYNKCMFAGMPKKKYTEEFMSLFTEVHYVEYDDEVEPNFEESNTTPFAPRSAWCWMPDGFLEEDIVHPEHVGNWFLFVGKK